MTDHRHPSNDHSPDSFIARKEMFTKQVRDKLVQELFPMEIPAKQLLQGDKPKIVFEDTHIPALPRGKYQLEAHQEVSSSSFFEKTATTQLNFLVEGPRFTMPETEIKTIFPPKGSTGQYHENFPHVSFNRISIPWEIEMNDKDSSHLPWLALVLFHGDEAPDIRSVALTDFMKKAKNPLVEGERKLKQLNIITIPEYLIPKNPDLQAHVRKKKANGKKVVAESSIAFANRLPKENEKNVAHLISLYDVGEQNQYISLFHWEFTCLKDKPDFQGLLMNVSNLPYRLFAREKEHDNQLFQRGLNPLPHFLRSGEQTFSLYQTPLLPFAPGAKNGPNDHEAGVQPRRTTWETLNDNSQVANVSYDVAFRVGQMLTMANKQVSHTIFNWKRQIYQQSKQGYLAHKAGKKTPEVLNTEPNQDLPDMIKDWVQGILSLGKIPFNYLVPVPDMLPEDAIRFFKLDKKWLKNCLDGVFSIGEEYFAFDANQEMYSGEYTGFLLRSRVVGYYPEMEVKAFANEPPNSSNEVPLVFKRKLSEEVMICCFKAEIEQVNLFLPPHAIHFGVERNKDNNPSLDLKPLTEEESKKTIDISGYFSETNILNLKNLQDFLGYNSVSKLAVQLVKNAPLVIFKQGSETGG